MLRASEHPFMGKIIIKPYEYTTTELFHVRKLCRDFAYFDVYLEFFFDKYYNVSVAWDQEKSIPVGVVVSSRYSFNMSGDFLWVDADMRRQGIGMTLLQHIEQVARQEGFRSLIWNTPETNNEAQTLYERFGGEQVGTILPLYDDPFRLVIYRKIFPENLGRR